MMRVYDYVYASGRIVRVKGDEASLFDVFAASPGLYRIDEYNPRTGAFMRAFAIYRVCGHITPVQLDGTLIHAVRLVAQVARYVVSAAAGRWINGGASVSHPPMARPGA